MKLAAHRVILLLLSVALALGSNTMALVNIAFTINQQYIANTLCQNKDKPQLQCKGKCYLKKQLQQSEQNTRHNTALLKQLTFDIFGSVQQLQLKHVPAQFIPALPYPSNQGILSSGFAAAIFHPPPPVLSSYILVG